MESLLWSYGTDELYRMVGTFLCGLLGLQLKRNLRTLLSVFNILQKKQFLAYFWKKIFYHIFQILFSEECLTDTTYCGRIKNWQM